MRFPKRIAVWKAIDGSIECDSRDADTPLFPKGEHIYELPIETQRQAAILLRTPEGFNALVEGFLNSKESTPEGQLDDALKFVARYFDNPSEATVGKATSQEPQG